MKIAVTCLGAFVLTTLTVLACKTSSSQLQENPTEDLGFITYQTAPYVTYRSYGKILGKHLPPLHWTYGTYFTQGTHFNTPEYKTTRIFKPTGNRIGGALKTYRAYESPDGVVKTYWTKDSSGNPKSYIEVVPYSQERVRVYGTYDNTGTWITFPQR